MDIVETCEFEGERRGIVGNRKLVNGAFLRFEVGVTADEFGAIVEFIERWHALGVGAREAKAPSKWRSIGDRDGGRSDRLCVDNAVYRTECGNIDRIVNKIQRLSD